MNQTSLLSSNLQFEFSFSKNGMVFIALDNIFAVLRIQIDDIRLQLESIYCALEHAGINCSKTDISGKHILPAFIMPDLLEAIPINLLSDQAQNTIEEYKQLFRRIHTMTKDVTDLSDEELILPKGVSKTAFKAMAKLFSAQPDLAQLSRKVKYTPPFNIY